MLDPLFDAALRSLYATLAPSEVLWVVTGSLSFALRGLPFTPHDIDIQTNEAGAYAIARLFGEQVTRPVTCSSTTTIRSHFGALSLHGLTIELMGDIQKRLPDYSWEPPVDLLHWRRYVEYKELRVPVLALAYEAEAYRLMGRLEKAALLAEAACEEPDA